MRTTFIQTLCELAAEDERIWLLTGDLGYSVLEPFAARSVAGHPGPCSLRLGKASEPVVHDREPEFRLGRAITVRPGRDVALISTGGMLKETVACAERLEARGLDARVLSMHTIKPLD